jgi:hypothetical protein
MSQVLDLASPPKNDILNPGLGSNRDVTPIVVFGMLALVVALSLISFRSPTGCFNLQIGRCFPSFDTVLSQ